MNERRTDIEQPTEVAASAVGALVKPPEGYRLLEQGEIIQAGDIYMVGMHHWEVTNQTGGRWNPKGYWPMARSNEAV